MGILLAIRVRHALLAGDLIRARLHPRVALRAHPFTLGTGVPLVSSSRFE